MRMYRTFCRDLRCQGSHQASLADAHACPWCGRPLQLLPVDVPAPVYRQWQAAVEAQLRKRELS